MATTRFLKPRTEVYHHDANGKGESRIPADDMTLNRNLTRITLIRPQYTKGLMVCRLWPCLDYADPTKLAPGRVAGKDNCYTEWIVRSTAAKQIGIQECGRATFLMYPPYALDRDPSLRSNNPWYILYYACKNALDSGNERWKNRWTPLTKGSKTGGGAAITPPTDLRFAQGIVYVNGDRDYCTKDRTVPLGMDPTDDLIVFQFPTSIYEGIDQLLSRRKTSADGQLLEPDLANPSAGYLYGDPVGAEAPDGSVTGGLIFTVFNPSNQADVNRLSDTQIKHSSWDPDIERKWAGYEVSVAKSYAPTTEQVFRADLDAAQGQRVRDKSQFWFDDPASTDKGLLRYMSVPEQCVAIARAFRAVPDLIRFAWGDHAEFFTDEVNGILVERKSVVMPGMEGEVVPERPIPRKVDPAIGNDEFGAMPAPAAQPAPVTPAPVPAVQPAPAAAVQAVTATRRNAPQPAAPAPAADSAGDDFGLPPGVAAPKPVAAPPAFDLDELFEEDLKRPGTLAAVPQATTPVPGHVADAAAMQQQARDGFEAAKRRAGPRKSPGPIAPDDSF